LRCKRLFPLGLLVLLLLTMNGSSIKTPRSINKEQTAKQVTLEKQVTNSTENMTDTEGHKGHWCNIEVTGYVGGQRTASGTQPSRGCTVAASPEIPFGTRVYIEDPYFEDWPCQGWFIVEDRGPAVVGNVVDVYFGDSSAYDEAINWGRKKCRVLIVPKD